MSRPFIFRINAAELFTEVHSLHHKQRSSWILQLAQDLLTLKPQLSYSEKLIAEALEFMEKKREAGSKGGRPSKTKGLPKVKQTITNAKPKANPEEETETEVIKEVKPSLENKAFELFWSACPQRAKRCGKAEALKSWLKHVNGNADEVIESVMAHSQCKDWKKDGGEFIPMITTWLNQHRWTAVVEDCEPKQNTRLAF